ncbi:MAG TPA: HEAT repeat domain-containing protein [Candidatus Eisenbacteria bacterium]|nr:HEAT repeat domain-containing protein [Candidatus Eisenbacteria bacterium]
MNEIAALLQALERQDKRALRAAVDALIPIARASSDVGEKLGALIEILEQVQRWPFAYVLAHLPQPRSSAIETLLQTLGAQDAEIRWAVALLLVKLAREEESVSRRLLETLAGGNELQRRMAVYCIRDLNLSDRASLQALMDALSDRDPMVRVAAVSSLKNRADFGPPQASALLRLVLRDPDSRVKNAALISLALLAADSLEFEQALSEACSDADPRVRRCAAQAVALLQKKRPAPSSG